jgi:hypothetical protein
MLASLLMLLPLKMADGIFGDRFIFSSGTKGRY